LSQSVGYFLVSEAFDAWINSCQMFGHANFYIFPHRNFHAIFVNKISHSISLKPENTLSINWGNQIGFLSNYSEWSLILVCLPFRVSAVAFFVSMLLTRLTTWRLHRMKNSSWMINGIWGVWDPFEKLTKGQKGTGHRWEDGGFKAEVAGNTSTSSTWVDSATCASVSSKHATDNSSKSFMPRTVASVSWNYSATMPLSISFKAQAKPNQMGQQLFSGPLSRLPSDACLICLWP